MDADIGWLRHIPNWNTVPLNSVTTGMAVTINKGIRTMHCSVRSIYFFH